MNVWMKRKRWRCCDFARVRRCLRAGPTNVPTGFRPCTEMFAGRSNECTYIGDSESRCVGRNISVSFCRMRVVLFNLWTSSCSTIIIKIVFLADTCSDSDFDFWILILKFDFSPCSKYLFIYFKNFVFARSKYFELIVLFLFFFYNLILIRTFSSCFAILIFQACYPW